ncbi:MAG: glycosyltransferase [Longimicrobiaceae bacterium]
MHVLVLPSWYPTALDPVNGIFFREQAQALAAAGARVGVAAPILRGVRTAGRGRVLDYRFQLSEEDDGGVATLRAQGWSVPKLGAVNRRLWGAMARRLARRYAARHGRPDVVHAHSALAAGEPAAALARAWRVPCVITEHTSMYAEGRIEPRWLPHIHAAFAGAARVVAVSRALAADLAPHVGSTPVEVVPNLVDAGFFTLPPRPRGGAPYRFLTVALFDRVKGMDVLLRAFAGGFAGRDDVVLEIGGGGPLEPSLRALAAELGIAAQTRFLGILTRAQVREAMWRADAFVLSSHIETFGVVVIEAMATGLPVAATACGGPQDTVVPGETGLLVPPGDPPALAAAMRRLHAERDAWAARAEPIRRRAESCFSHPVVVGRLLEVYAAARAELTGGGR